MAGTGAGAAPQTPARVGGATVAPAAATAGTPPGAFDGIWPILFAFFDEQGALDRGGFERQIDAALAWGAPGIAALGLATEVGKLGDAERREVIGWVGQHLRARRARTPFAITIHGETVDAQRRLADAAVQAGAAWLILQPPPLAATGRQPESFYIDFFAAVMDGLPVPAGIQNAPEYLGVGLSPPSLVALARRAPRFAMIKGEASSTVIRETIEAIAGQAPSRPLPVLNGRGGLELLENLAAGCAGLIVAPDSADHQHRVYQAWRAGDHELAAHRYANALPSIVFTMQSLESLIVYGKRIAALRLGLPLSAVHDRAPTQAPTAFGLRMAQWHARRLGPLAY